MFNYNYELEETQQIHDKIHGIKSSFLSVLDNYKKYYVFSNLNPSVEEYQQAYFESKNQLSNLLKEILQIIYDTYQKINNLNTNTKEIYNDLSKSKQENILLNTKIKNLKNTKQGSNVIIDDFKEKYNDQFYYNLEIFLGILLVGGIIKTTFIENKT
jgi:hypothetical protein